MHHAAMPPLPFPHHAAHRQVVDEDQEKRELAGSRGTRINCSTWGGVQVVCPFQWCPPRWSRPPRASFLRLRVSYTHLQTVSLILPSILSPRTTTLPRQCSACRGSCRNPKCIMPIMPIPPILKPIMPYGRASGRSAALRRLLRRHVVLKAHANRQRRPQTLQIVDTAASAVARVRLATAEATVCTWPMPMCQGVPQVDVSCLLPFDRVGPCVPAECATHQLSSTYQFAGRVLRSLPKRYPNLVLLS